ncbi:MAG: pantoate--beta-alanine ligase [Desulfobacteraceae bacterium 4572_123]|nr:MAG: pantoate--beta-alanine ligase [Desulfobacteraceae bacterium 4572_123]
MKIIKNAKEMQAHSDEMRCLGKKIVFVPTMGFLHEGHLSLMREGLRHGDYLVVSIFVNPTQFAQGEDLDSYPRSLERDLELVEKEGAGAAFTPRENELYPEDFQTYVSLESLPRHLCGISRPTFFRGVTTVVSKLFNIVKPHIAVFGEKDYQQLIIIRRMVRDMNFDIGIVGAPTIREPDGLAMSSRNAYLTKAQRPAALSLYKSLLKAKTIVQSRIIKAARVIDEAKIIITAHAETDIDYINVCDPRTLDDMPIIDRPALMALAVRVGKTRLIDNVLLVP